MSISYSKHTDLIEALKQGEAQAYTFLAEQYHHKLCVYAFNLSHDHDNAEDIVQDVFISVWQQRHKLKADFFIQGFLYKLVYNKFIDNYRKKKSVIVLEKKYIEALDTIVEDVDETRLEKLIGLVKVEIQQLPPKCKQTFLLSKQDGLTNFEIAEYLNVSIKTVEAQMTKSFSIIRKNVGDKMHGILFLLFGMSMQVRV